MTSQLRAFRASKLPALREAPAAAARKGSKGFSGKDHTVAGQSGGLWAVGEVGAQMGWKLEHKWSNTLVQ